MRLRKTALGLVVGISLIFQCGAGGAGAQSPDAGFPPAALANSQVAGRVFLEGINPGDRFQGRLLIWSLEGAEQSVLGPDVSLFEPRCVAKFGRGIQCAYLVAVLNGRFLETFDTSSPGFVGHLATREAADENLRIFFDPAPAGTRSFENLGSFEAGTLVATYNVREFGTFDPVAGLLISRNNLVLASSQPFNIAGVEVDFKKVAPRATGLVHARTPQPDPNVQSIPTNETPFGLKGPGFFVLRAPVSGMSFAVQSP